MAEPSGPARATPGQTVGPFFGFALPRPGLPDLVPVNSPGAITLHGTVLDGAGAPVVDALLEIWQPGPDGVPRPAPGSLHRDPTEFTGWGRAATDGAGRYRFTTLAPGPAAPGAAPFVSVCLFARGLLDRLFTRVYLPAGPGDPDVLARDPFLAGLPEERRRTLVARREPHDALRFDIHLQGEQETVFLRFDADAGTPGGARRAGGAA